MNVRKVKVIYSEEGNNCWGRARGGGPFYGAGYTVMWVSYVGYVLELCG